MTVESANGLIVGGLVSIIVALLVLAGLALWVGKAQQWLPEEDARARDSLGSDSRAMLGPKTVSGNAHRPISGLSDWPLSALHHPHRHAGIGGGEVATWTRPVGLRSPSPDGRQSEHRPVQLPRRQEHAATPRHRSCVPACGTAQAPLGAGHGIRHTAPAQARPIRDPQGQR